MHPDRLYYINKKLYDKTPFGLKEINGNDSESKMLKMLIANNANDSLINDFVNNMFINPKYLMENILKNNLKAKQLFNEANISFDLLKSLI
ncbi:hypothetical protein Catovirus_1_419 [Catovirus CTV1]|uniref:Uncharacterized protein n=1 Tax=Catovirus CTV1 TaxID=1977631 RepID=A0A1V0S9K3_9VIRU|nr:hypothetical protein Catovirus_1_419 [Catovirus CTV1]